MIKKTYKINGMHCPSCAMDIDGTLEDTTGVKSATTNYAKSITEVEFDESKIKEPELIQIIKKIGYSVV